MFSLTFGGLNNDINSFDTDSSSVNVIGVLVTVAVLIMIAIVLINLIIAQMTSSYQTVKDNAVREWGFSKARLVKQYLRREEKLILSTVPAPFNLLIIFIAAIAYVYMKFVQRKDPLHDELFSHFYENVLSSFDRFVLYLINFPLQVSVQLLKFIRDSDSWWKNVVLIVFAPLISVALYCYTVFLHVRGDDKLMFIHRDRSNDRLTTRLYRQFDPDLVINARLASQLSKNTKEIWGIFKFKPDKNNTDSNNIQQQIDQSAIRKIIDIFQNGREMISTTDVDGLLQTRFEDQEKTMRELQREIELQLKNSMDNNQNRLDQLEQKMDRLIQLFERMHA